jgi:hypothetical protein
MKSVILPRRWHTREKEVSTQLLLSPFLSLPITTYIIALAHSKGKSSQGYVGKVTFLKRGVMWMVFDVKTRCKQCLFGLAERF